MIRNVHLLLTEQGSNCMNIDAGGAPQNVRVGFSMPCEDHLGITMHYVTQH